MSANRALLGNPAPGHLEQAERLMDEMFPADLAQRPERDETPEPAPPATGEVSP